jgi:hypothetical protein
VHTRTARPQTSRASTRASRPVASPGDPARDQAPWSTQILTTARPACSPNQTTPDCPLQPRPDDMCQSWPQHIRAVDRLAAGRKLRLRPSGASCGCLGDEHLSGACRDRRVHMLDAAIRPLAGTASCGRVGRAWWRRLCGRARSRPTPRWLLGSGQSRLQECRGSGPRWRPRSPCRCHPDRVPRPTRAG